MGCQSTTSLGHTRRQLGFIFSSSASPCGVSSNLSSLNARSSLVPSDVLAPGAQDTDDVYVRDQPFTLDSSPSHVGGSAWFLSCAFWICLQVTRLAAPSPVLCTLLLSAPLVVLLSQILIRVSDVVDTMLPLSSINCRGKKRVRFSGSR